MQARRHVDDRLQPELDEEPGSRQHDEKIVLLEDAREAAQDDEGEDEDDEEARDEPELFAGDGKDEIGMRVRKRFLDRTLARPLAPEAAIHEGFDRAVDLIAVARGGIEETVDAARHMRQEKIGADEPGDAAAHPHCYPVEAQPDEEELREPDHRNDNGHAEIGLLDEEGDHDEEEDAGDGGPREIRSQLAFGKEPSRHDRKARLDEFRRLQGQPGKVDPAPRALDFDSRDEGHGDEGDADEETDHGEAADRHRRLQRDDEHDEHGNRQQGQLAPHEMHAVVADALGHGRARRHGEERAEPDQHGKSDEAPAIDRPPPARDGALIGAREGHARSPGSAVTSARNASPRASKFTNWSKDAQAGDSKTTAPVRRSRVAAARAALTAAASSPQRL